MLFFENKIALVIRLAIVRNLQSLGNVTLGRPKGSAHNMMLIAGGPFTITQIGAIQLHW